MTRRRKPMRRPGRGLGQAGELLLYIENSPDLAKQKGAIQTALVDQLCHGGVTRETAVLQFTPLVRTAQKRLSATQGEGNAAISTITRDFQQEVNDCVESPFCNLPPAAERTLRSKRCRLGK